MVIGQRNAGEVVATMIASVIHSVGFPIGQDLFDHLTVPLMLDASAMGADIKVGREVCHDDTGVTN